MAALPMAFEPTPDGRRFVARGAGYGVVADAAGVALALRDLEGVVELRLRWGTGTARAISGTQRLPGVAHDLRGAPRQWRRGIPRYRRLRCESAYPGVDVELYGVQRQLEYDFVLDAGVDPGAIRIEVEGADAVRVAEDGRVLELVVGEHVLRQPEPTAWQVGDGGARVPVEVSYTSEGGAFGFRTGSLDPALPLVIDPVVVYGSYLGGSNSDRVLDLAIDPAGNAYVVGITASPDLPTAGPSSGLTSTWDAFVAKVDPTGTALIYSTYLGGNSAFDDYETALAVGADAGGHAVVVGKTAAADFPVQNAVQPQLNGNVDSFVAKLLPDGSGFVYSTYLGGSAEENTPPRLGSSISNGGDVFVDAAGSAWVVGTTGSADFPVRNALQPSLGGGQDAFVARFDPAGGLLWSTYFGGSSAETANAVRVDAGGGVLVAGVTGSADFPVSPGAWSARGGGYVAKLDPAGAALTWATRLPSAPAAIDVDATGAVYLGGSTRDPCFPVTYGAWQTDYTFAAGSSGQGDGWLGALRPDGSALTWATYLGVYNSADAVADLKVDRLGQVVALLNGDAVPGGVTAGAKVVRMSTDGALLCYEYRAVTRPGGAALAIDGAGGVWIGGSTSSPNSVPVTAGAFQPQLVGPPGSLTDGFVVRLAETVSGVSGLAVATDKLARGDQTTATVALDGPAPATGLVVALRASPAGSVSVPAQVTVPPGAVSVQFAVSSSSSAPRGQATITAIGGAGSASDVVDVWYGARYGIVDLGRLGGGQGVPMHARKINNRGLTVGFGGRGSTSGFAHDDATGLSALPIVPADLAETGAMAGDQGRQPVLFVPGMALLNVPLFGGATTGAGHGVNDARQVAGRADPMGFARALLFTPGAGSIDLGTLNGVASTAYDVNNRGHVVGESFTDPSGPRNGGQEAFLWTPAAGMRGLGTLPGDLYSFAYAVNDVDEVTGTSVDWRTGDSRAFRWQAGVMQEVGRLPGDEKARGLHVNDHGHVVGTSSDARFVARGFLYTDTDGIVSLQDLVDPADAFGWQLRAAHGVNDLGQIVGEGESRANARWSALVNCETTAFRLDPLLTVPYGRGCAGSNGLVWLAGEGTPAGGEAFALRVAGAAPGAAGVLWVGTGRAATPLGGGCTLWIQAPLAQLPFVTDGDGRLRLPVAVPVGTAQAVLTAQAFVADRAGVFGYVASNGLEVDVR